MRAYEFLYEKALVPNELGKRKNLQTFITKIKSGEQFELVSGGTVVLDKEFLTFVTANGSTVEADLNQGKFPPHPNRGHGWPIAPKPGATPLPTPATTDAPNDDDEADNSDAITPIGTPISSVNNEKDFSNSEWIHLSDLQKTQEYQGSKGVEETTPIKPSDLVQVGEWNNANGLKEKLKSSLTNLGTPLANIIIQAIDNPNTPIENLNALEHQHIIQKYAGEYLGLLALMEDNITHGKEDVADAVKTFDAPFTNSEVKFPSSKTQKLVDSYIKLSNGNQVKISSKQKNGCGAASALSGVLDKIENSKLRSLPDFVSEGYPQGADIIETLVNESQVEGPLTISVKLGIITEEDKDWILNNESILRKATDKLQIDFSKSENLSNIIDNQNTKSEPRDGVSIHPNYRVLFHIMMGITNLMTETINKQVTVNGIETKQFGEALKLLLNHKSYMQILTECQKHGTNDIKLVYSVIFPAKFSISPVLWTGKSYAATKIKGKAGFKIKC